MRTAPLIFILTIAAACASLNESRNRRFTPLSSELVRDLRLGLLWTSRDAGQKLDWNAADRYCRELELESGDTAWRLPSAEELGSLYDLTLEQPCGDRFICRTDPAIALSTPYQWSATAPHPDRRVYRDLSLGSQLSPLIRPALTRGTLCVSSL
jgi:hypothetical protein